MIPPPTEPVTKPWNFDVATTALRPKAMDGMVEENGTTGNPSGDPLAHSPGDNNTSVVVTSVQSSSSQQHHLVVCYQYSATHTPNTCH
uniref:Uncharacterized protein n=1 Tax=Timema cristinae TaxID=61476 RepID=A0A7R9HBL2_TIMCR|nr:unnamed protein product [Timema cristinae]